MDPDIIYPMITLQMSALQRLEVENDTAARSLEQVVTSGEELLDKIQTALSDIAQTQLKLQALENQESQEEMVNNLSTSPHPPT